MAQAKRQVALDTETTGMDCKDGHRLISIGCVEIVNRSITKREFSALLNPEREVDEEAALKHGYTWQSLQGQPYFVDVVDDFLAFIKSSELLIHNADFDVGFLDMELEKVGKGPLSQYCDGIVDTLALARALRPGQRSNLDALCSAYGVDNTDRTLHGALIDAQLLAQVYLAMTRGQETLEITTVDTTSLPPMPDVSRLRVLRASEASVEAHRQMLAQIDKKSKGATVWKENE